MLRHDYDFIIVGGGTAGCVIANRLSANPKWNILVLEAGKPESTANFVPGMAGYLIKSNYDWGYIAEKTPGSCLGNVLMPRLCHSLIISRITASEEERCPYHAGRALGGSSTTNYMLFTRGNQWDFNEWEDAGNEGWGYEGVLPYFKSIETATSGEDFDAEFRGSSGEMVVGYPPYRSALTDFFVIAAKEAGHELTDYNGEKQLGLSYIQSNLKNGRRVSSASAFIHPIYKKRKNLHIITSAMVSKVLIDADTKTAVGVSFNYDGQSRDVYAKKEVILSAGALRSPQLLMLSGIGPSDHLKQLGITVIKDLPVGNRYYDHTVFPGLVYTTNTTNLALHIKQLGVLDVLEFIEGKGKFTSPVNIEAVVYGKMENSSLHPEQPDYELLMLPGTLAGDLGTVLASVYKITPYFYERFLQPLEPQRQDKFTVLVHQMRPKSAGYIRLRDNNIESHPLFYPNFFTHPDDVEAQLAGVRDGMRIASGPIFKALGAQIYSNLMPGCEHLEFGSDDYWRCAIPVASVGTHHQTGTCRMGPEDDEDSVVDDKLRVHGIKRLRVADNSIIPSMVCAHTHAVALMIGEKFSDIIKQTWREDQ